MYLYRCICYDILRSHFLISLSVSPIVLDRLMIRLHETPITFFKWTDQLTIIITWNTACLMNELLPALVSFFTVVCKWQHWHPAITWQSHFWQCFFVILFNRVCEDFDLCEECIIELDKHDQRHAFIKLRRPGIRPELARRRLLFSLVGWLC